MKSTCRGSSSCLSSGPCVQYAFDESIELEACLSYNNLDFEDITVQAKTEVSPSVRTFRFGQ